MLGLAPFFQTVPLPGDGFQFRAQSFQFPQIMLHGVQQKFGIRCVAFLPFLTQFAQVFHHRFHAQKLGCSFRHDSLPFCEVQSFEPE